MKRVSLEYKRNRYHLFYFLPILLCQTEMRNDPKDYDLRQGNKWVSVKEHKIYNLINDNHEEVVEEEDEWGIDAEIKDKIYHKQKQKMGKHRARRTHRRIQGNPEFTCFKPAGVPQKELENIELRIDEYEAMRLSDIEGVSMRDGAEKMGVSAPTFNRMVNSAHKKLAEAVIEGKAIIVHNSKEQSSIPETSKT